MFPQTIEPEGRRRRKMLWSGSPANKLARKPLVARTPALALAAPLIHRVARPDHHALCEPTNRSRDRVRPGGWAWSPIATAPFTWVCLSLTERVDRQRLSTCLLQLALRRWTRRTSTVSLSSFAATS